MNKSDIRKYNDNKNKKMKYWKKIYPFINVKEEQYEEFSKNFMKLKKVIDILDFVKELDIDMEEYNRHFKVELQPVPDVEDKN